MMRKRGSVRKGSPSLALVCVALLLAAIAGPVRASDLALPVPRATIYPGEVIGEDNLVERAFIARRPVAELDVSLEHHPVDYRPHFDGIQLVG